MPSFAIVSTDLKGNRDYNDSLYSIETADGAKVATVHQDSGKLADAILSAAIERWNGQHGEHMTLADFAAGIKSTEVRLGSLGSLAIELVASAGQAAGTLADAASTGRALGTFER